MNHGCWILGNTWVLRRGDSSNFSAVATGRPVWLGQAPCVGVLALDQVTGLCLPIHGPGCYHTSSMTLQMAD
jgi:hypothetical protein